MCYQVGTGVARNLPEAVSWYALAAHQGHAEARTNMEICSRLSQHLSQ